jgi:hypothetical protein
MRREEMTPKQILESQLEWHRRSLEFAAESLANAQAAVLCAHMIFLNEQTKVQEFESALKA